MVGETQSLADLYLDFILIEPMQFILDANLRNTLNFLNNHFKKFQDSENTICTLGKIKLAKKALPTPAIAPVSKKAEKAAKAKGGKPKN